MRFSPKMFCTYRLLGAFICCQLLVSCSTIITGDKPYSFIQMSDPQFGMFRNDTSFEKETENYTKAILAANHLKPAFVIVTGDLINKPFDAAQAAEYKKISGLLNKNIPLYSVAGNHDVENVPTAKNIADYNNAFGPDFYTFQYRDLLGIVLNSMYLHSPQNVAAKAKEQEQWLVKTLQEVRAKKFRHIMVFMHHPFFLENPQEADQYFNIPLSTRKQYLNLFKQYGVQYLFSGHYHRNAFGTDSSINMITTGPVGKPLGKDPSGFRIVTINGNSVDYPYYSLDSIPQKRLDQ